MTYRLSTLIASDQDGYAVLSASYATNMKQLPCHRSEKEEGVLQAHRSRQLDERLTPSHLKFRDSAQEPSKLHFAQKALKRAWSLRGQAT
ncbi:hypothetical protein LshimejAT787_0210340 [Lyophyllum shimeji]|uniref:Uncharacterized protein n=1 Tax=Lyophyllum shimeji TaxID=47721 RepID=A0A9P3UIG5_LYOSH|nr:hypothetical protein LshimejAT787_0210340 [Lyophyllum shimeji]